MWELDCEESWALKNWCFWTVVLEKTLESPLDCKVIQPVYTKGNLSWIFIGRTDVEAETPILWPRDAKSWLIWKDPDAGEDWRQEKGMTEDEMAGWHHWLDGREPEWTPGVGDWQGGLVCCDSWGRKELDTDEWLNWTELNWYVLKCFAFSLTDTRMLSISACFILNLKWFKYYANTTVLKICIFSTQYPHTQILTHLFYHCLGTVEKRQGYKQKTRR